MRKIGVIGAGSWGTALGALLAENGENKTVLWAFEPELAEEITRKHTNSLYLKGETLPKNLTAVHSLEEAISGAEILINVVPSHLTRRVWEKAVSFVAPESLIVNASKGFEFSSRKRLSQVLMEVLACHPKENFATLSGPSFAKEVIRCQPTTVVIAGCNASVCKKVQQLFRADWFLTYVSEDVIGVEVGGAVKNVIAIASGIVDGMELGLNTRAALITRGLYEMAKIGKALGAHPMTFLGLTGIGDLVLTCTGELSRNRAVGLRLGRGEKLKAITNDMKTVAEGVKSAKVVYELTQEYRLGNPVCTEIYKILYEEKAPSQALKDLLAIELKEELGGLFR